MSADTALDKYLKENAFCTTCHYALMLPRFISCQFWGHFLLKCCSGVIPEPTWKLPVSAAGADVPPELSFGGCAVRFSTQVQKCFHVASLTAHISSESFQVWVWKVNFRKWQLALFVITLDLIQISLTSFLLLLLLLLFTQVHLEMFISSILVFWNDFVAMPINGYCR